MCGMVIWVASVVARRLCCVVLAGLLPAFSCFVEIWFERMKGGGRGKEEGGWLILSLFCYALLYLPWMYLSGCAEWCVGAGRERYYLCSTDIRLDRAHIQIIGRNHQQFS